MSSFHILILLFIQRIITFFFHYFKFGFCSIYLKFKLRLVRPTARSRLFYDYFFVYENKKINCRTNQLLSSFFHSGISGDYGSLAKYEDNKIAISMFILFILLISNLCFCHSTQICMANTHKRTETSGVNFTNMFTHSFWACRSKKHKKTDNLTVFFTLLGSKCIKAARRTLMKLTPVIWIACFRGPIKQRCFVSNIFDQI